MSCAYSRRLMMAGLICAALEIYLNMGSAFFSKGDYSQAVEAFRQALAVRPNSYQGHYNLGIALLERNQPGGG